MYFPHVSTNKAAVFYLLSFCVLGLACAKPTTPPTGQINIANVAAGPSGYNGDLHGTVESSGDTFLYVSDDIEEAIAKTTLAKLTLSFAASANTEARTIELPEKAMSALDTFFKSHLRYYFVENLNGPQHAPDNLDYDRAVFKNFQKAVTAVQDIEIDAPDGRRKISSYESEKLVARVVIEAIKTWKAAKAK